jgi:tetratricopeptide (TPR) repeat protein
MNMGNGIVLLLIASGFPIYSQAPSTIDSHARQAQEYLRANHPELAIPEFAAIVSLDPKNVDARGNLGVLLFFQGDYAKATPQLREALALRPGLWKLQALLGMSEKRIGQIAAARADLDAAFPHLEEEKLRVQAGLELIELHYASGDVDKAAAVVGILRQLRPTDPDVLYAAQRIYSDLADEAMVSIAMTAPQSARTYQLMAHQLARLGDAKGAIEQCRTALKMDPRLPGLHFELAEALSLDAGAANPDEIEAEYEAALKVDPYDEKSESRLGEIAARRSDLQSAAKHYARAVELAPNDAEANLGLGKTLMSLQQPEKAKPYLERAAQLDPYNAVAHYHLATLYRQMGRTEDSKRELAEFQKVKDMKDRLKQVYKEMRLQPVKPDRPDASIPK